MESIDGVIAFLSGRYREIERDLEARMKDAAAAQEFEQAALERNRLRAVRSLLRAPARGQRGGRDARRGRRRRRRHRRQRPGLPDPRRRAVATASRSTSTTRRAAGVGEVAAGVPAAVLRRGDCRSRRRSSSRPTSRTSSRWARRWPSAAARTSRCARPSAATSAGSSTSPSATRCSRSTRSS